MSNTISAMSQATEAGITNQPPPPRPSKETFAPIHATERLVNIDFVRGMALLGILLVNVISFFGPFASIMEAGRLDSAEPHDRIASLLVLSLCQGKFISIFSMLFGYGLLGQIDRAAERDGSPVLFTLRRLGALLVFGLIHATMLWYGDILFVYAAIGIWFLVARYASARVLIILWACLLLFGLILRGGLEGAALHFTQGKQPTKAIEADPELRGFQAIMKANFDPSSPIFIEAEKAAYSQGPWLDAQVFRLLGWVCVLLSVAIMMFWQILAMFLLGGALWRIGYFSPEKARLRLRVCLVCLPLGLCLEAVAGWFFWNHSMGTERWAWYVGGLIQQVALFFLPLGYLSALSLLAERVPQFLRAPVCAAGRMSLTVYLLETVIATALAYHWGFGLFGQVGALAQVGLAVGIWMVVVALAWLWLLRFRQGPMEWVWRKLAYSAS